MLARPGRRRYHAPRMNVTCPHCAAAYRLPPSLLGPAGARVRCPACSIRFRVAPDGGVHPDDGPASGLVSSPVAGAAAAATATVAASGPHAIAREIIGELVARHGAELSDSVGRRELFSRHGADLLAAFDDYRRRAGEGAGSEPFRLELRERLGVDLFPRVEPR